MVFDTGRDGAVTIAIRDTLLRLRPGVVDRPDATVRTDIATLWDMLDGVVSGVQAFVEHRLTVRGNLSLALQTEGVLDVTRPAHFPRFGLAGSRGRRTPYLEAGPPDGPPLLMLHGLGATSASMLPLIAELSDSYRVIAPDLPGFGGSDAPLASYDAAFFARWVDGLLAELRIGSAAVLGNSLGGRISLEVALALPHRVSALVLLTPAMAFRKLREFVPAVTLMRPELAWLPMVMPRWLVHGQLRGLFAKPERLPDSWYDAAVDEFLRIFRTPRGRVSLFAAARQRTGSPSSPRCATSTSTRRSASRASGAGCPHWASRRCSCGATRTASCRPASLGTWWTRCPPRAPSCWPTAATCPSSSGRSRPRTWYASSWPPTQAVNRHAALPGRRCRSPTVT